MATNREIDNSISERVKQVRKSVGLTQIQFAERLEANVDEIRNIELGRLKEPHRKKPFLKLICYEFNISRDWLFYGEGGMIADDRPPLEIFSETEEQVTEDGTRLIQMMLNKPKDEREKFYKFCIYLFEGMKGNEDES